MTAYNPAEVERLIAEAREVDVSLRAETPKCTCDGVTGCEAWCPRAPWDTARCAGEAWCRNNLAAMADQLEAALAEIESLRCGELLGYLKGHLPAQRHADFEKHIERCAKCRAASMPHVNAELATIGPLMTQAEAEQLRAERAAEREDSAIGAERVRQVVRAAVLDVLPEAQEDAVAIADRVSDTLTSPIQGPAPPTATVCRNCGSCAACDCWEYTQGMLRDLRAKCERLQADRNDLADDYRRVVTERDAARSEIARLRSELDTATAARAIANARSNNLDASHAARDATKLRIATRLGLSAYATQGEIANSVDAVVAERDRLRERVALLEGKLASAMA
jgi:hypothetical protein